MKNLQAHSCWKPTFDRRKSSEHDNSGLSEGGGLAKWRLASGPTIELFKAY